MSLNVYKLNSLVFLDVKYAFYRQLWLQLDAINKPPLEVLTYDLSIPGIYVPGDKDLSL